MDSFDAMRPTSASMSLASTPTPSELVETSTLFREASLIVDEPTIAMCEGASCGAQLAYYTIADDDVGGGYETQRHAYATTAANGAHMPPPPLYTSFNSSMPPPPTAGVQMTSAMMSGAQKAQRWFEQYHAPFGAVAAAADDSGIQTMQNSKVSDERAGDADADDRRRLSRRRRLSP